MKHVVVDPVTRIEGHLRLELQVDEGSGRVEDALSSGTAWRGLELIMKDRDPRDAWAYVQRICGVCTTAHALASCRAVEDALGIRIPKNANYIRNLMAATQTVQDHVVHFYHLHALDWVSPLEALKASPEAAARLQDTVLAGCRVEVKGWQRPVSESDLFTAPQATVKYFAGIKKKVQMIADSGQLGIFAAQWWDHPDYQLLPPEVHLLAIAHYIELLDKQRELVTPHVVFGGKNPHPHYVVGGMPCSISQEDGNAPVNSARLAVVDKAIELGRRVVNDYYVPDLMAIAAAYFRSGYTNGGGLAKKRVLAVGSYPIEPFTGASIGGFFENLLVRCNGVVENFANGAKRATVSDFNADDIPNPGVINESIDHAWYEYPDSPGVSLHPWDGVTKEHFTKPKEGTEVSWKALDEKGKYSWIKTPKWRGKLCEVGPLARYIIVYTKAQQGILGDLTWAEQMMLDQIAEASRQFGLTPEQWMPTMVGRTVVRGLDAQLSAEVARYYFDRLIANIKRNGDTKVAGMDKWEPSSWPKVGRGVGFYEAPRGALSHWVVVRNGKIDNYQAVVPSTWNACPRDDEAGHGAYEAAMLDTTVKLADKPLEILKVIRSFDPCMACATHFYNAKGEHLRTVTTDPYAGTQTD